MKNRITCIVHENSFDLRLDKSKINPEFISGQKSKIRLLIVFVILMMNKTFVMGQYQYLYREYSVNASCNMSGLSYQLSSNSLSSGLGIDIGGGYSFFFSKQMAFHFGGSLRKYNARANLNNEQIVALGLIDSEGDVFNLHTTLLGYRETQKILILNVPLMILYHKNSTRATLSDDGLYLMGGVKLGLPVMRKYQTTNFTLTNEGFYPKMGDWARTQEFAGYGTFNNYSSNGDFNLGISVMLAFEAGKTWRLNKNVSIYAGGFLDISLNNVVRNQMPFVNYTNSHPVVFTTNSAMMVSDKVRMVSTGVKAHLAFEKINYKKKGRKL